MTGYAPPGLLAWDLWLTRRDDEYHLFHLQAEPGLHPELRHGRASVGHAVSRDLTRWEPAGTALAPGPPGAWDDKTIWTGSVLARDGDYAMLYTGLGRSGGLVQRIGLATSPDLHTWTRHPENPVLRADPAHYQTNLGGPLPVEDWRDPSLCRIAGRVHAFVTARTPPPAATSPLGLSAFHARELAAIAAPALLRRALAPQGPLAGRGCVALATSDDLVHWTVEPPALVPGGFGMVECPQHLAHAGLHYLFFSSWAGCMSPGRAQQTAGGAQTGLFGYVAEDPRGPYRPVNEDGVVLDSRSNCYATRVIRDLDGRHRALSWLRAGPDRFRITPPWRVVLNGDRVRVSPP